MKRLFAVIISFFLFCGLMVGDYALAATSPGTPQPGGVAKLVWATQSTQIGVPSNIRGAGWWFASFALEPLVARTAKIGVYDPVLASSWELAPDNSYYIFHLKKGVKFHDGSPFNAQAAKWNLDKVLASKKPFLQSVSSFEVIDDYTLKANLKKWDALILDDMQNPGCFIMSPKAYETKGEEWCDTNPIGTSPFKIKKFERNIKITYEKNTEYREKGFPFLDGIEIITIEDPMTQMASLIAGEVHILREVDVSIATQLQSTGKFQFENHFIGHMVLFIDNSNPKSVWYDKRMREALEYAINKEEIVKGLGYGFFKEDYEILLGIGTAGTPGTVPRKYDPEKAKKLMAEAGHPGGGVKVTFYTNNKFNDSFVGALQGSLAKVGIEMLIQPQPNAAWEEMRFTPIQPDHFRYDRVRGGSTVILPFAKEELASNAVFYPGTKRPEGWDDLINKALTEKDSVKQIGVLEEMERRAYGDVMAIPLWVRPQIFVFNPAIKSLRERKFVIGGMSEYGWMWKDLWIEKKK